jgi:hypothetical protein
MTEELKRIDKIDNHIIPSNHHVISNGAERRRNLFIP